MIITGSILWKSATTALASNAVTSTVNSPFLLSGEQIRWGVPNIKSSQLKLQRSWMAFLTASEIL